MSILGNIFLVLAGLAAFALIDSLYFRTVPRGGDAAVGYLWGIIFINLAFAACILLAYAVIGWKGGFQWVAASGSRRFWIVTGGLLAAVFTAAFAGLLRGENGPVALPLRAMAVFAPALIPIVLIAVGFMLLNFQTSVPEAACKWPLYTVFGLGALGVASGLYDWAVLYVRNTQNILADRVRFEDENHQRHLNDIDSCDVSKNMVFILVFTDANHAPDVRERALAKIKTNPRWEDEMIRLLECDWAPEAFTFFASNEVDDKQRFAESIRKGVLIQAKLIRESRRNKSYTAYFYPDEYSWEIRRVLRAVERFEDTGIDYMPAVRELRAALDAPTDMKDDREYQIEKEVDKWIQKHSEGVRVTDPNQR